MYFRLILLSYFPEEDNLILETLRQCYLTLRVNNIFAKTFSSQPREACSQSAPLPDLCTAWTASAKTEFNFPRRVSSWQSLKCFLFDDRIAFSWTVLEDNLLLLHRNWVLANCLFRELLSTRRHKQIKRHSYFVTFDQTRCLLFCFSCSYTVKAKFKLTVKIDSSRLQF